MGYRFIKHLDSPGFNRKLFYLDRGAEDLPAITDRNLVQPGSECVSLLTGEKWVLNTCYHWIYQNGGESFEGDFEVDISEILVAPASIMVGKGDTVSFHAIVKGPSDISNAVVWKVKGNRDNNTKISSDGTLSIGANESARTLSVSAVSTVSPNKVGQATVVVNEAIDQATRITGIYVYPTDVNVLRGKTIAFHCELTGIDDYDKEVIWSVVGNTSEDTVIRPQGHNVIVTVGADESANAIVIKCESASKPEVYDSSTVIVENETTAGIIPEVTDVTIQVPDVTVSPGEAVQIGIDIMGVNGPSSQAIYSIEGNTDPNTYVTSDGILVIGENETSESITVTATSIEDATKTASVEIPLSEREPELDENGDPKVDEEGNIIYKKPETVYSGVCINPSITTVNEGATKVFSATVLGKNYPSQEVTWSVDGNKASTTYISEAGVLAVGFGEKSRSLEITAVAKGDTTKGATAYVSVLKAQDPERRVSDVPTSPLNAEYVRLMGSNGRGGWTPVHFAEQSAFEALSNYVGESTGGESTLTEKINSVDNKVDTLGEELTEKISTVSEELTEKCVQKEDLASVGGVLNGVEVKRNEETGAQELVLSVYDPVTGEAVQQSLSIPSATQTTGGLMSAEDKEKLDHALEDIETLKTALIMIISATLPSGLGISGFLEGLLS